MAKFTLLSFGARPRLTGRMSLAQSGRSIEVNQLGKMTW